MAVALGIVYPCGALTGCMQNRQVEGDAEGIELHSVLRIYLEIQIRDTGIAPLHFYHSKWQSHLEACFTDTTRRFLTSRKYLLNKCLPEFPWNNTYVHLKWFKDMLNWDKFHFFFLLLLLCQWPLFQCHLSQCLLCLCTYLRICMRYVRNRNEIPYREVGKKFWHQKI